MLALVAPYNFQGVFMKLSVLIACAVALFMAGCGGGQPDKALVSAERATYQAVRTGDDKTLAEVSAPHLRTPAVKAELAKIGALLPRGAPKASKLVGWNIHYPVGREASALMTSEHDYGDRVVLAQTSLRQAGKSGRWIVEGFHVQIATDGELAVNNFGLAGKRPGQYLFLIAAALSPALMIGALVKVIRTRGLKRKWLWGVAAFLGVAKFQMNWATGVVGYQLLSVQLIGAGARTGFSRFDPWLISMTLPVGAALILAGVWANPARAKRPVVKRQGAS